MKKTIFDNKMEDPDFKTLYDEVAIKLGIGEEIARLRQKRKMTQLELAERAHTSRSAVARYESGNYTRYNLQTLIRIAKALQADLKISFGQKIGF
jgi:transcriptional regulator with XRE-family HTH domain